MKSSYIFRGKDDMYFLLIGYWVEGKEGITLRFLSLAKGLIQNWALMKLRATREAIDFQCELGIWTD